jgi:hypothetical protein
LASQCNSEAKMPTEHSEIDDLRKRLRRLEAATARPRGWTGMAGAAAYINRSREWLRREHLAGRGPKRRRRGTRGWDYSYADLDAYLERESNDA